MMNYYGENQFLNKNNHNFFHRIQRKFKLLLVILLTVATLLAFWFAISVYGYTSANAVNLFLSLCIQYFFTFAAYPLFFEAAVEVTYPVPEGKIMFVRSCHHASTINHSEMGHLFHSYVSMSQDPVLELWSY